MRRVYDNLFVGSLKDCVVGTDELAVVHACKWPCHVNAVGSRQLPKTHPNYLALRDERNLWLNIIDPPIPLFQLETFHIFLDFMRQQHQDFVPVLIHCNQGLSRSPTLAMLFLSKVLLVITDTSYNQARIKYREIDESFWPSGGIRTFLALNWDNI